MKRTPYNIALERLDEYIKSHGLRPSGVRNAVLEQICLLQQPFTAEQLTKACEEQRISTGTVYNSLNILVAAQILHGAERQRGRAATEYELITGNTVRMQIICQKCGRVSEFNDKAIERLINDRKYSNFILHNYSLFVYGECKVCRKKRTKQAKE